MPSFPVSTVIRLKLLSLFTAVIALLSISCSKPTAGDEEIRQKLVGTWLPDAALSRTLSGEVTYKPDSTFAGFIVVRRPDITLTWQFAGKWNIKSGALNLEYTASTAPKLLAIGTITSDRIVSITDKELTFISEEGKRETRRRKLN